MIPDPPTSEWIDAALRFAASDSLEEIKSVSQKFIAAGQNPGIAATKILAKAYLTEKDERERSDGLLKDWLEEAEGSDDTGRVPGCYPAAVSFLLAAAAIIGFLIGRYS